MERIPRKADVAGMERMGEKVQERGDCEVVGVMKVEMGWVHEQEKDRVVAVVVRCVASAAVGLLAHPSHLTVLSWIQPN